MCCEYILVCATCGSTKRHRGKYMPCERCPPGSDSCGRLEPGAVYAGDWLCWEHQLPGPPFVPAAHVLRRLGGQELEELGVIPRVYAAVPQATAARPATPRPQLPPPIDNRSYWRDPVQGEFWEDYWSWMELYRMPKQECKRRGRACGMRDVPPDTWAEREGRTR